MEPDDLAQGSAPGSGRLRDGVGLLGMENPFAQVTNRTPGAVEQTQTLARFPVLIDGLVAPDHLLVAGLPLTGVVEGPILSPSVVVAVLVARAWRSEDQDVVG